jgi:hypothetical protein
MFLDSFYFHCYVSKQQKCNHWLLAGGKMLAAANELQFMIESVMTMACRIMDIMTHHPSINEHSMQAAGSKPNIIKHSRCMHATIIKECVPCMLHAEEAASRVYGLTTHDMVMIYKRWLLYTWPIKL